MAHNIEPMDIDTIDNGFDNKENTFRHGNFLSKTPCTDKGYEELDVSELNMKLRYSITPASSPMSKSLTLSTGSKNYDRGDNSCLNTTETCNMSRSLNSTITINDTIKSAKNLPLQPLLAEHFAEGVKQVLRPLDTKITKCADVNRTVSPVNDDENLSLPSSSSSMVHTPEATTPTKEISKQDEGSPIMRGLKSVFSIFRTSQSPTDNEKTQNLASPMHNSSHISEEQQIIASTPVSNQKGYISKISPNRESIMFKDDLEKELQWKEDTTIIFSQERVPPHKLFPQLQLKTTNLAKDFVKGETNEQDNLNTSISMDISLYYNDCSVGDVTMAENNTVTNITAVDSDNEFLDCETTFKEECIPDTIPENQHENLTKIFDDVKESDSQSAVLANSTLNVQEKTESGLSHTTVFKANECVLCDKVNEDTLDFAVQKTIGIVNTITQNNETEKDSEASPKEVDTFVIDISNTEVNNSIIQDTIVKTEHIVGADQNVTVSNEEKMVIEQCENKKRQEKQIFKNVEEISSITKKYEHQNVNNQNERDLINHISNEGKELEIRDSDKFELTNYNMTMTPENDTTINVILNIDTFFKDDGKDIIKKSDEDFQDVSKQEVEILHKFPVNLPLREVNDFDLLNDSIIATQDETSVIVPVINDIQSEIAISNETLLSSMVKSSENSEEAKIGTQSKTKDISEECIINNVDETVKLINAEDITLSAQFERKLQNFGTQELSVHVDDIEKIEKDTSCNLQVENFEYRSFGENPLYDEKTKKEIENDTRLENITPSSVNINKVTFNSEEDIVVSENNSPYVSLSANVNDQDDKILEKFGEIKIPFTTQTKTAVSPPISPKLQSKGYNFNYDDISDPFATKIKKRISSSLENFNRTINIEEEGEKSKLLNKILYQPSKENLTRSDVKDDKIVDVEENQVTCNKGEISQTEIVLTNVIFAATNFESLSSTTFDITNDDDKTKNSLESLSCTTFNIASIGQSREIETQDLQAKMDSTMVLSGDCHSKTLDKTCTDDSNAYIVKNNNASSSEQSEYLSAEQSNQNSTIETTEFDGRVNETLEAEHNKSAVETNEQPTLLVDSSSQNVFNIPKVDENNIPDTATNQKQQPTTLDPDITNTVQLFSENDNIITKIPNNEENSDDLNCTNSSKMTDDKNDTVREINTEDEDTMEGPFLETEDLNIIDKVAHEYDQKPDMMQFMDLTNAENNEDLEAGEIFIDAEAFEFLLNQNTTNVVSDCGKESLFLKFDPLFAKRPSFGVISKNNMQRTPNKNNKQLTSNEQAGPSTESTDTLHNVLFEDKSLNSTTKPTMIVTPAVNSVVPKIQTAVSSRLNRHSFTLTSPAMAVIDRLLLISDNHSLLGQDTTLLNNDQQETNQNFTIQIQELLAEKEFQFRTMKTESSKLRDRLSILESQVEKLVEEGQERLKNISALNKQLEDKTKENRNMAAVVEEYERTIASLLAEREQEKKQRNEERKKLIKERDEQIAHLTNMECSFNDLHSKYEKSKQIILGFKANEDAYKKTLQDFEDNLTKMQNNYELLKQHATSKLNHANQELDKMNKTHAAEVLKLKAMIKRKDVEITSLEESLTQKTKANDELTAICDELINKVG